MELRYSAQRSQSNVMVMMSFFREHWVHLRETLNVKSCHREMTKQQKYVRGTNQNEEKYFQR